MINVTVTHEGVTHEVVFQGVNDSSSVDSVARASIAAVRQLPAGGSTGKYLGIVAGVPTWVDAPEVTVSGDAVDPNARALVATAQQDIDALELDVDGLDAAVAAIRQLPATGTTGHVLTRTASGWEGQALPAVVDATARATASAAQIKANTVEADLNLLETTVAGLGTGGGGAFFIDTLAVAGNVSVAPGVFPAGIRIMANAGIVELTGRVGTAPVGSALTFDLTRNGTVIATLSIPAGSKSASTTFAAKTLTRGDILNLNVTAVGSTTAGANLAFTVADNAAPYSLGNVPGIYSYYDMALQGGVDGQVLSALNDTYSTHDMTETGTPAYVWDADVFGTGFPGIVGTTDPGYSLAASPFRNVSTFTLAIPLRLLGNHTDGFLLNTPFQHQIQMFGNDRFSWRLSNNGTSWGTVIDSPNLTLNANKLLIFRVGGGRAQLEINGTVTNDVAFTGPLGNIAGAWSLGSNPDGGSRMANAAIGTPVVSLNYLTGDDLTNLRTKLGASIGLSL